MELIEMMNSVRILSDYIQIVNFPFLISNCDALSRGLLDLFSSSLSSICYSVVFPSLGNTGHFVVSLPIDIPLNSKGF